MMVGLLIWITSMCLPIWQLAGNSGLPICTCTWLGCDHSMQALHAAGGWMHTHCTQLLVMGTCVRKIVDPAWIAGLLQPMVLTVWHSATVDVRGIQRCKAPLWSAPTTRQWTISITLVLAEQGISQWLPLKGQRIISMTQSGDY